MAIIYDMPINEYHKRPELSSSGAKKLLKSLAHYQAYITPDENEPEEKTAALSFGNVAHCSILEPGEFEKRYVVLPKGLNRTTKAGKEAYEALLLDGREIVYFEAAKTAKNMAESIAKNPDYQRLKKYPHIVEASIFFDRNGVKCRFRPDFAILPCADYPNGVIIDLKSTEDASQMKFGRHVFMYNYHLSAEFYMYGWKQEFKTDGYPEYYLLPCEKERPFANCLYELAPETIDYAFHENERLIQLYKDAQESGEWLGYESGIIMLPPPNWLMNELDGELEDE